MNREDYLKYLIEIKYGTVKAFSEHIKLPYTTIRSILSRGVMNAKMGNIIKICDGLDINPLVSLNPKYKPIRVTETDKFTVQGVVLL